MFKTRLALLAALAAGAIGLSANGAAAFPAAERPALETGLSSEMVIDVRQIGGGGFNRPSYRPSNRPHYRPVNRPNYRPGYRNPWNYGYHGPRCRSWSNSCRFYYGGWYYNSPWWTVPVVGAGVVALANGAGSRHRAWCAGRYKSYNAKTNTYVSSSGKTKQCNSPYD